MKIFEWHNVENARRMEIVCKEGLEMTHTHIWMRQRIECVQSERVKEKKSCRHHFDAIYYN